MLLVRSIKSLGKAGTLFRLPSVAALDFRLFDSEWRGVPGDVGVVRKTRSPFNRTTFRILSIYFKINITRINALNGVLGFWGFGILKKLMRSRDSCTLGVFKKLMRSRD